MSNQANEDLTREEENILYWVGMIMLPIGLGIAYAVTQWIIPRTPEVECFIWSIFGVYCPGCGGTRALVALAEGEILLSIWYHPLIMYGIVLYAAYMITHTLEKLHIFSVKGIRFTVAYLYGALGVIAINCVLKNVLKFGFGIMM